MISNEKYQAIAELDFSAIKFKLMHRTFGEGWSQAKADAMETEYRRFLYLQYAFPNEQTAPTLDVDTFWHYHILDTMKYAADCDKAFGHFLHHYPYLGLMEDDEPDVELEAGNRTRALYEQAFGEPYIRADAYREADGQSEAARCQGLCIVATPQASIAARVTGNGLRLVAKQKAKGATMARCNAVCTVAGPKAKIAAIARCNAVCTVAAPATKVGAHARCNAVCTVAAPRGDVGAVAGRQGLCIGSIRMADQAQGTRLQTLPIIPATITNNQVGSTV